MLKPEDFDVTLGMHRDKIELRVRLELVAETIVEVGEPEERFLPEETEKIVKSLLDRIYKRDDFRERELIELVDRSITTHAARDAFYQLLRAGRPDARGIAKRVKATSHKG